MGILRGEGFEVGQCYGCSQGQVFIAKSQADGAWFVVCEECFTEWADPEAFRERRQASFGKHGRYIHASREEVKGHPWSEFIGNVADLETE